MPSGDFDPYGQAPWSHTSVVTTNVITLDLGDGENCFNPTSINRIGAAIDEVASIAATDEKVGLVTTGTGKFFSNGIDLEWMFGEAAQQDQEAVALSLTAMLGVWAQVMSLPIPTVAAVNGHAFAGGAMFALVHDHVLMRADRGFLVRQRGAAQASAGTGNAGNYRGATSRADRSARNSYGSPFQWSGGNCGFNRRRNPQH